MFSIEKEMDREEEKEAKKMQFILTENRIKYLYVDQNINNTTDKIWRLKDYLMSN